MENILSFVSRIVHLIFGRNNIRQNLFPSDVQNEMLQIRKDLLVWNDDWVYVSIK
jgi:hypothetical protein